MRRVQPGSAPVSGGGTGQDQTGNRSGKRGGFHGTHGVRGDEADRHTGQEADRSDTDMTETEITGWGTRLQQPYGAVGGYLILTFSSIL